MRKWLCNIEDLGNDDYPMRRITPAANDALPMRIVWIALYRITK